MVSRVLRRNETGFSYVAENAIFSLVSQTFYLSKQLVMVVRDNLVDKNHNFLKIKSLVQSPDAI